MDDLKWTPVAIVIHKYSMEMSRQCESYCSVWEVHQHVETAIQFDKEHNGTIWRRVFRDPQDKSRVSEGTCSACFVIDKDKVGEVRHFFGEAFNSGMNMKEIIGYLKGISIPIDGKGIGVQGNAEMCPAF